VQSTYQTRIPVVDNNDPGTLDYPTCRDELIEQSCVGITGRKLGFGYRPNFVSPYSDRGLESDDTVGCLDAPDSIPAGGTCSGSRDLRRGLSLAWYRS